MLTYHIATQLNDIDHYLNVSVYFVLIYLFSGLKFIPLHSTWNVIPPNCMFFDINKSNDLLDRPISKRMTFFCSFNRILFCYFWLTSEKCTQKGRLYRIDMIRLWIFIRVFFLFCLFCSPTKTINVVQHIIGCYVWVHLESGLQYKMLKCAERPHNAKTKIKQLK